MHARRLIPRSPPVDTIIGSEGVLSTISLKRRRRVAASEGTVLLPDRTFPMKRGHFFGHSPGSKIIFIVVIVVIMTSDEKFSAVVVCYR